jgi:hypothetical protein
MKNFRRGAGLLFAAWCFACGLRLPAEAAFKPTDDAIFAGAYKEDKGKGQAAFAWWMPKEWWQATFDKNPALVNNKVEEAVKLASANNMIFAVSWEKIGEYGMRSHVGKDEMRKILLLQDKDGNTYAPLDEADVPAGLQSLFSNLKTYLADRIYSTGDYIYFFVFPSRDAAGKEIAGAGEEGGFKLKMGEKDFSWKLPLPALIQPKKCPECGKEMPSSDYKFCPWDGTDLNKKKETEAKNELAISFGG